MTHVALVVSLSFVLGSIIGPGNEVTPTPTAPGLRCKGNPKVSGTCFTLHGRLSLWNGTPMRRISRTGTKRILGIADEYALPPSIAPHVQTTDNDLYGDYEVCPLTAERTGVMQMVCVESARHLVLDHLLPDGKREIRHFDDGK